MLSIFLGRGITVSVSELEVQYPPDRKGNTQGRQGFRRRQKDCTGWEAFPASAGGPNSDGSIHLYRESIHCNRSTAQQSRR